MQAFFKSRTPASRRYQQHTHKKFYSERKEEIKLIAAPEPVFSGDTQKISQFFREIAEQMKGVGGGLQKASENFQKAGNEFVNAIHNNLNNTGGNFGELGEVLDDLHASIQEIKQAMPALKIQQHALSLSVQGLDNSLGTLKTNYNTLKKETNKMKSETIEGIKQQVKTLGENLSGHSSDIRGHTETISSHTTTLAQNKRKLDDYGKEIKRQKRALSIILLILVAFAAAIIYLTKKRDELVNGLYKELNTLAGDKNNVGQLIKAHENLKAEVAAAKKDMEKQNEALKNELAVKSKQLQNEMRNVTHEIESEIHRLQTKYNDSHFSCNWVGSFFGRAYSHQMKMLALSALEQELSHSNKKDATGVSEKTKAQLKRAYSFDWRPEKEDTAFKNEFLNKKMHFSI